MSAQVRHPSVVLLAVLMLVLVVVAVGIAGCASGDSMPAGAIPTASRGDLSVSTDHASFGVNSPVGVVLVNASQTDYYATDGRSACTLVQLQRYDSGQRRWLATDGCVPATQPRPLLIAAGTSEPFTLAPTSAGDPNAWQPGLYRVALAYSANTDGVTSAQTAYCAGFVVQG